MGIDPPRLNAYHWHVAVLPVGGCGKGGASAPSVSCSVCMCRVLSVRVVFCVCVCCVLSVIVRVLFVLCIVCDRMLALCCLVVFGTCPLRPCLDLVARASGAGCYVCESCLFRRSFLILSH